MALSFNSKLNIRYALVKAFDEARENYEKHGNDFYLSEITGNYEAFREFIAECYGPGEVDILMQDATSFLSINKEYYEAALAWKGKTND